MPSRVLVAKAFGWPGYGETPPDDPKHPDHPDHPDHPTATRKAKPASETKAGQKTK